MSNYKNKEIIINAFIETIGEAPKFFGQTAYITKEGITLRLLPQPNNLFLAAFYWEVDPIDPFLLGMPSKHPKTAINLLLEKELSFQKKVFRHFLWKLAEKHHSLTNKNGKSFLRKENYAKN